MNATNSDNAISELKNLIENRACTYYPELSTQSFHIKGAVLKKGHQSIIYQFDIHNTNRVLKSLIIKKRIFNKFYNNNIVESTQKEFDILKHLNNISHPAISAPQVLDAIPEQGLLISEKVNGESLYSYLKRTSYLPITRAKKVFAKQIFAKTGEWLRNFHNAGFQGEKSKINTREFIGKAGLIVSKFSSMGLPINLGNAITNKMRRLEKDVLSYAFPVSTKHGDFQPQNIVFWGGKITVLDISAKNRDISIKDVCNFITGSIIIRIKLPFSFFNARYLNDMIEEFLKVYYGQESIPYPAIEFVKFLGLLEQLDYVYNRNINFFKRKAITAFYINHLNALLN